MTFPLIMVGMDVLKTFISTKTDSILAQIGDVIGESVDVDSAEWWQHVGFSSRPSKPDAGKAACQAVVVRRGQIDAAFASRDIRCQKIYGNLKDGETCIWAGGVDGLAQARVLLRQDGSCTMYTTDSNTELGKSVYFRVHPERRDFVSPWGTEKFDLNGYHLRTKSGARFDLGPIAGLPSPFDAFGNVASIQANMISLEAAAVMLGAAVGQDAVALSTFTNASLTALQVEVAALGVWCATLQAALLVGGLTPIVGGAMVTPTAALAATMTAGALTVAAQAVLIPAKSVTAA